MAKEWYLTSPSNYFSGYENDEFSSNAVESFEELLNNSPESYDVIINDNEFPTKVIVQQKSQDERYIHARIGEIKIGDLVKHKSFNWLVIDHVDDNKMNLSTKMKLCNSTFPLKTDKTKVLIGYNEFDEPIYEYIDGEPIPLPCIVESNITSDNSNEAINLPEGRLNIIIPFTEHEDIADGKQFTMYGAVYNIIGIDYTKVINKVGVLTIQGKRKEGVASE